MYDRGLTSTSRGPSRPSRPSATSATARRCRLNVAPIRPASRSTTYIDGNLTRPGFAWSGLMAALLADNHPLGVLLAAFLLGVIQVGSTGMERTTQIPLEISSVVQAVIVLFVSVRIGADLLRRFRGRRAARG